MKNLNEPTLLQGQLSNPETLKEDTQLLGYLLLLSKEKYLLHLDEAFPKEFTYFFDNLKAGISNTRIYDEEYLELLHYLFHEESLFAEEIIELLKTIYGYQPGTDDLVTLTEMIICSEWQLSFYQHEQEEFTELYSILMKNMTFRLGLTVKDFYIQHRSFLTHLKFLAYRVVTKQRSTEVTEDDVYFFTKNKYTHSFNLANHLRQFITEHYDFDLSNDEITFLTMHIQQIAKKQNLAQ